MCSICKKNWFIFRNFVNTQTIKMTTDMKKTIIAMAMLIACAIIPLSLNAEGDKPIAASELPTKAQTMIQTHFEGRTVMFAKREQGLTITGYEAVLDNGVQIEFNRNGEWTEIDCGRSSVPSAVVPSQIAAYVKQHFAGESICQIEQYRKIYEVELTNGIEIKFNRKFKVVEIER